MRELRNFQIPIQPARTRDTMVEVRKAAVANVVDMPAKQTSYDIDLGPRPSTLDNSEASRVYEAYFDSSFTNTVIGLAVGTGYEPTIFTGVKTWSIMVSSPEYDELCSICRDLPPEALRNVLNYAREVKFETEYKREPEVPRQSKVTSIRKSLGQIF